MSPLFAKKQVNLTDALKKRKPALSSFEKALREAKIARRGTVCALGGLERQAEEREAQNLSLRKVN